MTTVRRAMLATVAAGLGVPLSLAPFASLSMWLACCLVLFLYLEWRRA